MKLKVVKTFRDKTDHVTVYVPETILGVSDKERAFDLVNRGLCAEFKGKDAATVTLGEQGSTGEPAGAETPEGDENPGIKKEDAE